MLEALEVAALTLPVTDLILDIFEHCGFAKVRDGKDGRKHRLQTDTVSFLRDEIHLQETVVRLALHLDQIRDLRRCIDLGEIDPFGRAACPFTESVRAAL